MVEVPHQTQRDLALALLAEQGMLRSSELVTAGVTTATVARLQVDGDIVQVARGLYRAADADVGPNHALAVAAKLAPAGIICGRTALAYHELTERSGKVLIGVSSREWRSRRLDDRLFEITTIPPRAFDIGWSTHSIDRVAVKIYDPAKCVVDMFVSVLRRKRWYGSQGGIVPAITTARTALHRHKITIRLVARYAEMMGVLETLQPYLDAMAAV